MEASIYKQGQISVHSKKFLCDLNETFTSEEKSLLKVNNTKAAKLKSSKILEKKVFILGENSLKLFTFSILSEACD